jgi:hypothetical protein
MNSRRKRDSRSRAEHKAASGRPIKSAGEARDAEKVASPLRLAGRSPLWTSLLVIGLFVGGTLLAFTPRYETNDDVGMNASVAGRLMFSRPDEHLLYSNFLIGLVLTKCYAVSAAVPWYGGYLLLTAALSLAAMCYVCLSQGVSAWNWVLIASFLLVGGIPLVVLLQFTRVASAAAMAGIFLLAGSVRGERIGWQTGLAVPFLVVAGLIRYESFLLICLVLSPVIAWMFWQIRRWFAAWVPCAVLLGCVVLVFASHRLDAWYYDRDPDWKEFHRFNALRAEFTDFGHVEHTPETAPVIESVGWLPIDCLMLQYWACLDRERFNVQTMQAVVDGVASRSRKPTKPLLELFRQLAQNDELLGLLALGILLLMTLSNGKGGRFVALACYGVTAAVCVLLYEYLRLPARVSCPAFAACSLTLFLFSSGPRSFGRLGPWTDSALGRRVVLLLVAALFVWRGSAVWQAEVGFREDHRQAALLMKELGPRPNQLYVVWAAAFPYEDLVLPLDSNFLPRDFKVLGLDARAQTPPIQQRMNEFGVTDLESIAKRAGETYVICERFNAEMLRVYLQAHYGTTVVCDLRYVNPLLGAAAVWRLKIIDPPPHSS